MQMVQVLLSAQLFFFFVLNFFVLFFCFFFKSYFPIWLVFLSRGFCDKRISSYSSVYWFLLPLCMHCISRYKALGKLREHSNKVARRSPISWNSTREPHKFGGSRASLWLCELRVAPFALKIAHLAISKEPRGTTKLCTDEARVDAEPAVSYPVYGSWYSRFRGRILKNIFHLLVNDQQMPA